MATSSVEPIYTKHIREIKELASNSDFITMTDKITALTKFLFNNTDLIYGLGNEEFERSGITKILMESINKCSEQGKRDILRLLNIFFKTNPNLRNEGTRCTSFVQFLLSKMNTKEAWKSTEKTKYFIQVASYLLMNKDVDEHYDTESIRRIVQQILEELKDDNSDNVSKRIICLMFFSSAAINANITEDLNDTAMNKDVLNCFLELIRDYLHDFKGFYDSIGNDRRKCFPKYCLKAEYSFDQICQCIIYFSQFHEKVRMNIYQSGLYELLSLIFLLKNAPPCFLVNAFQVFSISCIDDAIKLKFKNEHNGIIEKFKMIQSSQDRIVKSEVEKLLDKYDISPSTAQTSERIFTLSSPVLNEATTSIHDWGNLDVSNWLAENNLDECRDKLALLTGRGLNELRVLMKEKNGKFQLIELLTSKLNINLVTVLEFMGALETIQN